MAWMRPTRPAVFYSGTNLFTQSNCLLPAYGAICNEKGLHNRLSETPTNASDLVPGVPTQTCSRTDRHSTYVAGGMAVSANHNDLLIHPVAPLETRSALRLSWLLPRLRLRCPRNITKALMPHCALCHETRRKYAT